MYEYAPWDIVLPKDEKQTSNEVVLPRQQPTRPWCKYVLNMGSIKQWKEMSNNSLTFQSTVKLINAALNAKNFIDHVYEDIHMTAACFDIESFVDKDEWVITCNTPDNIGYRVRYKDNYIRTEFYYTR